MRAWRSDGSERETGARRALKGAGGHTFDGNVFLTKRGVATVVKLLVQTAGEKDPTFEERFLERVKEAYYSTRESGEESIPELELFKWVSEMLHEDRRAKQPS